jgi:L-fucose isomerase-like protein
MNIDSLSNTPDVKIGVVGVSRDCFPVALTRRRLETLRGALQHGKIPAEVCPVVIETETDAQAALAWCNEHGVNAAVVYLGNFGPEGPTTLFAARFDGPVMVCAAAEENRATLKADRGDALCGLLSCSYGLGLRRTRAYIPPQPVGLAQDLAEEIRHFRTVARVVIGVRHLKIIGFGPRPQDFYACHAPLQPLYDLGIEVMENSELDLFQAYQQAAGRKKEIAQIVSSMQKDLGRCGNTYPELLPRLAQFETALTDFVHANRGACRYVALANKCWPAFERQFGFVPCFVNGRLAARGLPVACEVDIYGALSEYMVQLATDLPATLLDVNNSVPADLLSGAAAARRAATADLFMGFHCGNTCAQCMKDCRMNYQVIMNRLMEDGRQPDITRGTLEGQLRPGPATMFRLQSSPDNELRSYIAEGAILDINPATFGGTGVVRIPGFARFYRYVLVGHRFPHHAAFGFRQAGRALFDALQLLGVDEVHAPLPDGRLYPGENPFTTN